MTSLKCNYCGFVMQNTDLCGIEFTLISKEVLNQHQHGDKAICELHKNVPNCYSTIWKCPVCNALHWFKGSESNVENVYIPVDLADLKKVAAPIKGDKYAIFVDYILDLLTDDELTPQQYEQSTDYPVQLHALVNDKELIVYNDNQFTKPVRYYTSIVPSPR